MRQSEPNRRDVLLGAAGFGAIIALASATSSLVTSAAAEVEAETLLPFAPDTVPNLALDLAAKAFAKPRIEAPAPFDKLSYDQYRDIRFRPEQAIWRGQGLDFELQMFSIGYLHHVPVDIALVEGGKSRTLKADGKLFSIGPLIGKGTDQAPYGFSGFLCTGRSTAPTCSTNTWCSRAPAISARSAATRVMACPRAASPSIRRAPPARSSRSSAASGSRNRQPARAPSSFTRCSTAHRRLAPTSFR